MIEHRVTSHSIGKQNENSNFLLEGDLVGRLRRLLVVLFRLPAEPLRFVYRNAR